MKYFLILILGLIIVETQAGNAVYRLIEARSSDAIGSWMEDYQEFSEIVGYSSLGHIFLRSPSDSNYAVFYPFRASAKSYGEFDTIDDFEKLVILESGFYDYVLTPDHVKEIEKKLGALEFDQVYIPNPYPFLGGDESLESYAIGDIWVMLKLVDQMQGESDK